METMVLQFLFAGLLGGLLSGLVLRRAAPRATSRFGGWAVALMAVAWGIAAVVAVSALRSGTSESLVFSTGLGGLHFLPFEGRLMAATGCFFGLVGGLATLVLIALGRREG
jgi:hypothetical protein